MKKWSQIFPIWIIITIQIQPVLAYQLSFDGELREQFQIWDGLNKKNLWRSELESQGQKNREFK